MSLFSTVALGMIAGLTIFIGLPVARIRNLSRPIHAFLNALATGILIFLLWDILSRASEPINQALDMAKKGDAAEFVTLLVLFVGGVGVGLLGLVYFDQMVIHPRKLGGEASPFQLSLMIATGIGLHNFSEGLAIGQASRSGAIGLATLLIVGFGLHNATEGFGIAAPLSGTKPPSWAFLALAGLIGGGPTFLGTVLGFSVQSSEVFVLFLALAAGSIIYVIGELWHLGHRFQLPRLASWGIFLGLLAGYGTDLLLTWAGI